MNTYLAWFEHPYKHWRNYGEEDAPFPERDFQRRRCYDAERLFINLLETQLKYTPKRYESVEEIQALVNKICSYAWFKRRWYPSETFTPAKKVISVKDGRGRKRAGGGYKTLWYGYITIPIWARDEIVILHELAHAITPPSTGGCHGRFWARTFLELVGHVVGWDEAKLLRDAYKKYKVKYNPRRRLSVEAKAAARERFVKNYLKK